MFQLNKRRAFGLLFLLCFSGNVAIIFFAHKFRCQQMKTLAGAGNAEMLERMHTAFSFGSLFNKRFNAFFAQIKGKETAEVSALESEWKKSNQLPEEAVEFVYFNNGEPLNVAAEEKDDWRFLMTRFDCGQIRKFRTSGEVRNRIIKIIGGVGFERLEAKPGFIRQVGISGKRTFCAWLSEPSAAKSGVNGIIAFFHQRAMPDRILVNALFKTFSVTNKFFGYVNLFKPEESVAPENFDSFAIAAQVDSFAVKSGLEIIHDAGRELIVSFKPDGRILCCRLMEIPIAAPIWSWSLFFFWLPLLLRGFCTMNNDFRMSLRLLILVVFGISIALPLLATAAYWNRFIVSRTESAKIEAAHSLEQHLVQLDASYKQIFRTSRKAFADMIAIADGRPEKLQELIDQSIRLEIDGMFDTCLLIDPQGEFIRPHSGAGFQVRRLVLFNRAYREKVFEQFFQQGWVPFDLEAEYALYTPEDNVDLREFITLMPSQGKSAYSSLTRFLGKDLISLHNQTLDGNGVGGKEEVSSMLMSTLVENEDENPVAKIRQSLGDYVEFGFNANQSVSYVDLIRDANGRALYCAIMFSGQYNFAYRFLDGIFRSQAHWPAGVKYMAISGRLFCLSFPDLDLTQRMKWLMEMMHPPRNLHVEERRLNGRPHLFCAYVGKKCPGYVFVATISLDDIEKKQEPLKKRLFLAVLLIFATLAIVWHRLFNIAIKPAGQIMSGVRALESRQHSHKINLETGDEWQQLAETFNVALEGLKEIEAAHFVQTCILPGADVVSGNAVFAGKTVPIDDVGGDYYDAFALAEGELVFLMGDVSGHSISAALVVSMARAAFAAIVDSGLRMPHEILAQMNHLLLQHLRRAKMMTCFAGLVTKSGTLICSNAGQSFPFLIFPDGSVEVIRLVGYPLGVARKNAFVFSQIELPSRCRLVMFSDGLAEAVDEAGTPYGYDRFTGLVKKLGCNISREDFFAGIYAEIRAYSGEVPWNDDVTVAILDYNRIDSR